VHTLGPELEILMVIGNQMPMPLLLQIGVCYSLLPAFVKIPFKENICRLVDVKARYTWKIDAYNLL